MAMDLLAAKHQKEINGSQDIFSLEEDIHECLLTLAKPKNKFPIINKIDDYYSDNVFLFGELNSLRDELLKIISIDAKNKYKFNMLILFVEKAIVDKNNLYVTAD